MATKKYINLLQSHEPLMDSGDYSITVQQTLKVTSKEDISGNFKITEQKFSVFGERFFLEPGSVHSVYPPPGSLGEHTATFPHVILNRSTLPWERSVDGGRDGIWLALLLFDESETPKPKSMLLGDFKKTLKFKKTSQATGPKDNGPFHELGDGPDDQPISVIEVQQSLLEKLMPKRADLEYTAHSRRESLSNDPKNPQVTGPERAVVIGNRLPKANELSTVHLVSLESRFHDGANGQFNYGSDDENNIIQLVSLKSWSFTSVNPKFSLFGMLEHLNRSPSQLSQPFLNDQVLNLDFSDSGIVDRSAYGFQVNLPAHEIKLKPDNSRFFNGQYLKVEVPDSAIDADTDPQLDPFPDPTVFTIAMSLKVSHADDANEIPLLGGDVKYVEGGHLLSKYKPSLWQVPSTQGLRYRVNAEDGQEFTDDLPGVLPNDEFFSLAWVKDGSEFRFYVNGSLVATRPAPARMLTKDSPYFIGTVTEQDRPQFVGYLKQLHIFRRALPLGEIQTLFSENAGTVIQEVNNHFGQGMLALPHRFRKGKNGVSWYRGPLSIATVNPGFDLPAVAADQLLVFDQASGMFDTSFAAAWQLGRLMALEDRKFSMELYQLKRRQSLDAKRKAQPSRAHLSLGNANHHEGIGDVQKQVIAWMRRNYRLEHVPFQYLVPQVDMLPPESIRFFQIDPTWVRCLNDGAASIGRTSSADIDLKNETDLPFLAEQEEHAKVAKLSGFLLRSELVSGYPGLQILGYTKRFGDADNSDEDTALKVARREKLSDEVLLCIFEGDVKTVDLFQKPDVLHFGLDSDGTNFAKQLRRPDGSYLDEKIKKAGTTTNPPEMVDNPFASHTFSAGILTDRVTNFAGMAAELKTALGNVPAAQHKLTDFSEFTQFTSADFAMEMLEGAERVRFVRSAREEVGEIFKVVEEMPAFPGCEDLSDKSARKACAEEKLLSFIYSNLQYPTIARENGIEGTVVVSFVVDRDGRITGATVLRDIGAGCGQAALRVVNMMPRWNPGKQRGRAVRVQFTLPVKFRLQ